MRRLTIVVLPEPVEPTMAIFCPGLTESVRFFSTGSPSTYEKQMSEKSTFPCISAGVTADFPSSISFGVSRMSKILSAPARAVRIEEYWFAIMLIGRESFLEYCSIACIEPTVIEPPRSIRKPPKPATSTYCRLPIKFMTGPMIEPQTRALTEQRRKSSDIAANFSTASGSLPYDITVV